MTFSVQEQELLYSQGYRNYADGHYDLASCVFSALVQAYPLDEKYWRSLASSKQMEEKYEEALRAWAMTALLNAEDPLPHFHAAECLTCLQQHEEALKALACAEKQVSHQQDLVEKIGKLRRINAEVCHA